jgi:hypothetical protein
MKPYVLGPQEVVYIARRALRGTRLTIEAGEAFPIQNKGFIRGLAVAYGLDAKEAERMPFAELPYVKVRIVPRRVASDTTTLVG